MLVYVANIPGIVAKIQYANPNFNPPLMPFPKIFSCPELVEWVVLVQNQAKIMPTKNGMTKNKSIKGSVYGLKSATFWYSALIAGKITLNIPLTTIDAKKFTNPIKSPVKIIFC